MKNVSKLIAAAMFVPALASAQAPASAQPPGQAIDIPGADAPGQAVIEQDTEIAEEEIEEASKDWGVAVSLGTSVGQGTFVSVSNDTEFADEVDPGDNAYDRWNLSLSVSPSYKITDDFTVDASFAVVQWLTSGGGINEPGEFRFQDIGLGLGWSGYSFEGTGVSVSAGLSLSLPTSALSQASSLYVSTGLSGSVAWRLFDALTLSYSLGLGKDFHEFTSPVVEDEVAGADNVIWRAGGSERLGAGLTAIDGVNTEYTLSNSFSARFNIIDDLSFSVSYAFVTSWAYDVFEEDEFTAPVADPGRGVGQFVRTSFGLSYAAPYDIGVSLSANTGVQPKTADNRSYNFPFWNMDGAAANASSIRLGVSRAF